VEGAQSPFIRSVVTLILDGVLLSGETGVRAGGTGNVTGGGVRRVLAHDAVIHGTVTHVRKALNLLFLLCHFFFLFRVC
jgi:hypothetical protein